MMNLDGQFILMFEFTAFYVETSIVLIAIAA